MQTMYTVICFTFVSIVAISYIHYNDPDKSIHLDQRSCQSLHIPSLYGKVDIT